MIIKSNFSDYYDSMQKLGVDRSLIYNRYSEYTVGNLPVEHLRYSEIVVIGVCWQRFLGMRIMIEKDHYRYTYDVNEIMERLKGRDKKDNGKDRVGEFRQLLKTYRDFHHFYEAPIWVATRESIRNNCQLRQYDMHTQMDPYTIYQELQMWMGNLAEPRKPIPEVSNSDMIEAKGFDLKYSFRKAKSKKK